MSEIVIRRDDDGCLDEVVVVDGSTSAHMEDMGQGWILVATAQGRTATIELHPVFPGSRLLGRLANNGWLPAWLEDWIDSRFYVRGFVVDDWREDEDRCQP